MLIFWEHCFGSFLWRDRLPWKTCEQLRDLLNWHNVIDFYTLNSTLGYSRVHRLIRVLHYRYPPMLFHGHHPHGSIIECSREQDGDDAPAKRPGRRAKEGIDGRTVAILARPPSNMNSITGDYHVPVRWSHIDPAWLYELVVDTMCGGEFA